MCLEVVVPIVLDGAKAPDARVEGHHVFGHVVPGRVRIEAAVDLKAMTDE